MKISHLATLVAVLGLANYASGVFLLPPPGFMAGMAASPAVGLTAKAVLAGGLGGLVGLKLVALKAGAVGGLVGSHLARKNFNTRRGRVYRGYHRGRRAAEEQEVDMPMEQYFAMVAAADLNGCGLKMVCELEAADPSTLQDDERLILALFGYVVPPTPEAITRSAKARYDMAAFLGRTGRARACRAIYESSCPHSRAELMAALRSVDPQ